MTPGGQGSRRQMAVFVGAVVFSFACLALPGLGHLDAGEVAAAAVLATAGVAAVTLTRPLRRTWWGIVPAACFLAVTALLRDAQGASVSVFAPTVMVPVLWTALHGRGRVLTLTVVGSALVFLVPVVVVGAPAYPSSDLSRVLLWPALSGLAGYAVFDLVRRQRAAATAAAEAAAAGEAQQELLEAILDSIDVGVVACGPDGRLTLFNRATRAMHGVDADDEAGMDEWSERYALYAADGVTPLATTDIPLVRALREGAVDDTEIVIAPAGQPPVRARTRGRWLQGADGTSLGAVVAMHDITAQRANERLRDEFVALVSHELRTPLTAIVGYLEMLSDDADELTPDHARFVATIDRNARRLLRLVGDLLVTAQVESGRLALEVTDVDLADVAAAAVEAARPRAQAAGVDLHLSGVEHLVAVGDPSRIGQAIDNLLTNALKFTLAGGRVDLRVSAAGDWTVIEVADTGIGIPPGEQQRLFDRFFRASTATQRAIPGIGLGLAIVKAIVDAHGGTISLTSVEGAGTTFRIELPRRPAPLAVPAPQAG